MDKLGCGGGYRAMMDMSQICIIVTLATDWLEGMREERLGRDHERDGDDTGLIWGVVLWVGRYLGHKTREFGDRVCTPGMKREGTRLPSGALGGWPAGWGAGRRRWLEEGGCGAGLARVMVCSDGSFLRWLWDIQVGKGHSLVSSWLGLKSRVPAPAFQPAWLHTESSEQVAPGWRGSGILTTRGTPCFSALPTGPRWLEAWVSSPLEAHAGETEDSVYHDPGLKTTAGTAQRVLSGQDPPRPTQDRRSAPGAGPS